jgi:hypothetical protein
MPTVVVIEDQQVTVESSPVVHVVEIDDASPVVETVSEPVVVVLGSGASVIEEIDIDTERILGRVSPGAGPTEQLTSTQATTLINEFTRSEKGLVPPPGGSGTDRYLREDGTWSEPEGGGSGSLTAVTGDEVNIHVDNTDPTQPVVSMSDMPQATVKGRAAGAGEGQPVNLNLEELRDILNLGSFSEVRGASFTGFNAPIYTPVNDVSITIKEDCYIRRVVMLTKGGIGDCVVDIWKEEYADYPATVAETICAATKPTIVDGIKYKDVTLTDWDTALSADDTVTFHLESSSTFTAIFVFLILEAVGSTAADGYTDERARDIVLDELEDFDFSLYIPTSISAVPDTIPRDSSGFMFTETASSGNSSEVVASTAFVNPQSSVGATGYRKHPDGLIEQWGYDSRGGSSPEAITFPLAFPNAVFAVHLTSKVASGGSLGQQSVVSGDPSLSGFNLSHADSSVGTYWRALGN